MKADSVLPVMEELGDGFYRSAVYPSAKDRAKCSNGIPVRVIEYEVATRDDGGRKDSSFLLITSLLDPAGASAEDLVDLYAKRWEIESIFGELKTHQRGPGNVLRSKRPDGVLQENYRHLCTHYAILSLIGTLADEFDEDPLRFSFKHTLRATRRSLAGRPTFPPSETG